MSEIWNRSLKSKPCSRAPLTTQRAHLVATMFCFKARLGLGMAYTAASLCSRNTTFSLNDPVSSSCLWVSRSWRHPMKERLVTYLSHENFLMFWYGPCFDRRGVTAPFWIRAGFYASTVWDRACRFCTRRLSMQSSGIALIIPSFKPSRCGLESFSCLALSTWF